MRRYVFRALIVIAVAAVAVWAVRDWYLARKSLNEIPPEARAEAERIKQQKIEESLVPLQGTFVRIEGDRLTWAAENREQTPEGVVVSRTERTGRLVPQALVARAADASAPALTPSPGPDTTPAEPLPGFVPERAGNLRAGENIIVFIPADQLDAQFPQIWKVYAVF